MISHENKRRRRRHQRRSCRVAGEARASSFVAARFLLFSHALLSHRASGAFVGGGGGGGGGGGPPLLPSPPTRSTTKIISTSGALFARERDRRPAEDPPGRGTSFAEPRRRLDRPSTTSRDDDDGAMILVTRRASLASAAGCAVALVPRNPVAAVAENDDDPVRRTKTPSDDDEDDARGRGDDGLPSIPSSLVVPLQYEPALSAYTVSYSVGGSPFGAIVDTGSPFLLVPAGSDATCRPEYKWGCFRPEDSRPTAAGLGPTIERFDGNEGAVEWREGRFAFLLDDDGGAPTKEEPTRGVAAANAAVGGLVAGGGDSSPDGTTASQSLLFPKPLMTFGVVSESLMDGPGGIFLGLVKRTNKRIRPSFLGQSNVSVFSVDLREGASKSLTLYAGTGSESTSSSSLGVDKIGPSPSDGMPPPRYAVPLVDTLNRKYGDPTIHYVGVASSVSANGSTLATSSRRTKLYCIFDTGCSGMSVSPGLFDERYAAARANREKSLWGTVDVELRTVGGETVTLSAKRPITTPLGSERPWGKRLDGHLIVLGLSFLEGLKMTVDADGGRVWFEN